MGGRPAIADRVKLADSLLRTFLEQMLQDGVFHADPHPGNVMLLADGQLALIDFGAAGRLDPVQQAALRDLMAGVSRRDADTVAQAVLAGRPACGAASTSTTSSGRWRASWRSTSRPARSPTPRCSTPCCG